MNHSTKNDVLANEDNQPAIDLELGAQLIYSTKEKAIEMLEVLIDDLPEEQLKVQKAFADDDIDGMTKIVHKLHGALCYVGTPRLRVAVRELEIAAKSNNMQELINKFHIFDQEATEVLLQYESILDL